MTWSQWFVKYHQQEIKWIHLKNLFNNEVEYENIILKNKTKKLQRWTIINFSRVLMKLKMKKDRATNFAQSFSG